MADQEQNTAKNQQNEAAPSSDLAAQRSELVEPEQKFSSDYSETVVNTGLNQSASVPKYCNFGDAQSELRRIFLDSAYAAKLMGMTDRGVRKGAAAGKYTGAYKTPINGGEGWAIPLDALPAKAQALYWHEQFTTAGLTADLFEGGSSFTPEEREEHWKRYELATEKCQGRARVAFAALIRFNELLRQGSKKMPAYAAVMSEFDIVRSTFNEWQKSVDGLDQGDWLPALVPDFSGRTNARRADWPGQSWLHFLNGALTPGAPVATAYKRTKREAEAKGWGKLPSLASARRDFQNNVDDAVKTYIKEGPTALKRLSPTVERDYTTYALHELWSMDGRRKDLMVCDTKGEFGPKGRVFRLWFYAVEEVRTRYLVGYSLGPELNADAVRDAIVNAFTNTGMTRPVEVQCDNGMEAAAKEITGGAPWRNRGKVKEDEIIGLLPYLGIKVSWATTAHGQTKPVERMFGTLAKMCETRPEFRGAYCGHKPDARPEEWDASKAVPVQLVRELLEEEIGAYHRNPHRGHGMEGKSSMALYTELMNAPGYVRKGISQRQFRRCVLSAIPITIQKNGAFIIHGARYYSEQTARLPKGRGYYACYNRHDLSQPVYVYRGSKLVAEEVQQIERTPGNCKESAKKIMKARADFTKGVKARAKALLDIQEIDTPEEIKNAAIRKHPGIVNKETGEILPIAPVVEITQTAADTPKDRPPKSATQKAQERKQEEDLNALLYPRKKTALVKW